jgi:penicillin-binding protein 2
VSTTFGPTAPIDQGRPLGRFIAFGLVVVVATGALTARLGYLQLVQGADYTATQERQRTVLEAVPSTRGLIHDRNGVALVTNVPTYSVKIRPVDLPASIREPAVSRLAALLGMDATDINLTLDTNPGSKFDLVRIASDVPEDTARIISESSVELPGVEVVVETRRSYPLGPLVSQVVGYTGPISPEGLEELREDGYLPDDLIGKTGVEASYEEQLRGVYGVERVERDATGRRTGVLEEVRESIPGSSLNLTIDVATQKMAEKAMRWGMKEVGLKRGVVIVMNPQTGEILALVSLPTYDNNLFARGISAADFKKLAENRNQPLLNHAIAAHYPPGSTYKLVAGTGALADRKITPSTRVLTRPYLSLGGTRFYEWNRRGWGRCDLDCGFGHSSDTYFFQLAGMLGIDRLAHWAHQYGFGAPTGIDLPGEVSGIVPSNEWKLEALGAEVFPGETYQAGIGQGYDAVTPLQLLNAYAALANGGKVMQPQVVREVVGPDGQVVRPFEPKVVRKLKVKASVLREMREATRNVQLIRHTYNLVDLPIVMAGKSGTAEFGLRDSKGRLPFHSWFVAFVPKDPRKRANDPGGLKAVGRTDANLIVLAFAYDSRTKGNAATEIVKYFLQQKYKVKRDYRNFDLLERGNFYQSN